MLRVTTFALQNRATGLPGGWVSIVALLVVGTIALGIAGMGALGAFGQPLDLNFRHSIHVGEAAALGAASQLPDATKARDVAHELITANQQQTPARKVTCDPAADITVHEPGAETNLPAPFDRLGPLCMAVTVRTHAPSMFAGRVPLPAALKESSSTTTAVWGPAAEAPVAPLYIRTSAPLQFDTKYTATYLEDHNSRPDVPLGFGWTEFPRERTGDATLILNRLAANKTATTSEPRFTLGLGDIITARSITDADDLAAWFSALQGDSERPGRLFRAHQQPYSDQSIEHHSTRHPRLLIVPVVVRAGDGLAVEALAAIWLDAVRTSPGLTEITFRLTQHTVPGSRVAPAAEKSTLCARQILD